MILLTFIGPEYRNRDMNNESNDYAIEITGYSPDETPHSENPSGNKEV